MFSGLALRTALSLASASTFNHLRDDLSGNRLASFRGVARRTEFSWRQKTRRDPETSGSLE
jgi:hypothetical protein